MAENPTELSTEQLLIGLGKVVMGLGGKIEALGEKMDAILGVLSDDIAPSLKNIATEKAGESQAMEITPLIEKLDELKKVLEESSSDQPASNSENSSVLSEKLSAIEKVLSGEILPAIKEMTGGDDSSQMDLSPVVEKLDSVTAAIGNIKDPEELKPHLDKLSESLEKLPALMTDRLKELRDSDSSNPMENVEEKLAEVCGKLENILKISEDRTFVETLSTGISEIKEQLVLSGGEVLQTVKDVPGTIDKMGENLSVAMKALSDSTDSLLEKSEKKLSESNETLGAIKSELENGLKLNTDMTSQMVDLTARFADRAEEDRIQDMNTRAIGHFNRGEFYESDELFTQALELSPENAELLCNYAHLKAAMNEMEEAEKLFKKALEVYPDLEPALSGLGMLMVKTGRAEETIEFLKKVLTDGEPSVRTIIAYTRALTALDRHDKAVELLESTHKAAPGNPELNAELASYGHGENE